MRNRGFARRPRGNGDNAGMQEGGKGVAAEQIRLNPTESDRSEWISRETTGRTRPDWRLGDRPLAQWRQTGKWSRGFARRPWSNGDKPESGENTAIWQMNADTSRKAFYLRISGQSAAQAQEGRGHRVKANPTRSDQIQPFLMDFWLEP